MEHALPRPAKKTKRRIPVRYPGQAEAHTDTTLFLDVDPGEVDVEKKASAVLQAQQQQQQLEQQREPTAQQVAEAAAPAKVVQQKSSSLFGGDSLENTGCIFHNLVDRNNVNGNLLRAIQSEIERHTAEVKKAKAETLFATKHLNPNQHDSESVLGSGDSDTSKATLSAEKEKKKNEPFEHHVLQTKASSVDYNIRKELIKPPPGQNELRILRERKRNKKVMLRRVQDSMMCSEDLLRINPFVVSKKLDLLELREMLPKKQRFNKRQLPNIADRDAKRQYQVFNDDRLKGALYTSRFTDHLKDPKKGDGCEYLTARKKPTKSFFRFRDQTQLLAVTRKNRKMQKETKLDVINRIRDMNRCTMNLAIRRRMITFLNESITRFDHDITVVEQETEEIAREFDDYLHQSDQKTITSIHRAAAARQKRDAAERHCTEVATQNDLLNCHNIRTQEQTSLVDRFVNAVYALLPEAKQVEFLEYQDQLKMEHRARNIRRGVHGYKPPKRTVGESLRTYATFSNESADEAAAQSEKEEDDHSDDEQYELPPFPFDSLHDFVLVTDKHLEKSKEAMLQIAECKQQHEEMQTKLVGQVEMSKEIITEARMICVEKQKLVDQLRAHLAQIMKRRATACDDAKSREIFRRPIVVLQSMLKETVHAYIKNLTDRYPKVEELLSLLSQKLRQHQNAVARIPPAYLQKWYAEVVKNRTIELKLLKILHKKERRMQRAKDRRDNNVQQPASTTLTAPAPKLRSFLPNKRSKSQAAKKDRLTVMVEKAEEEEEKRGDVVEAPVVEIPPELILEEEEDEDEIVVEPDIVPEVVEEVVVVPDEPEVPLEPPFLTDTGLPLLPTPSTESMEEYNISDTVILLTEAPSDCMFVTDVQHFEPSPEFRLVEEPVDVKSKRQKRFDSNGFEEVDSNDSIAEATKRKRKELMDEFFGALKVDRMERGLVKSNESLPHIAGDASPDGDSPTGRRNSMRKSKPNAHSKRRRSTRVRKGKKSPKPIVEGGADKSPTPTEIAPIAKRDEADQKTSAPKEAGLKVPPTITTASSNISTALDASTASTPTAS